MELTDFEEEVYEVYIEGFEEKPYVISKGGRKHRTDEEAILCVTL